jgi:hypothetical protein
VNKTGSKKKSGTKEPEEEVHYHYHGGYGQSYSRSSVEKGPNGEKKMVHHHYYYEPPRPYVEKSNKPKIAGALIIITAILGIIFGGALFVGAALFSDMEGFIGAFSPTETGEVTGKITLVNGTPVENVNVSIVGEDISTMTDADGEYSLLEVPMGNKKIKIEKEGYTTIIKKAFINPSNSDANINVDPEADPGGGNEHDFVLTPGTGVTNTGEYPPFELFSAFMAACGLMALIFSVIAIIGGYFAMKRRNFGMAAAGAFFGILAVGFGIGTVMGIIALLVLFLAKDEFSKE